MSFCLFFSQSADSTANQNDVIIVLRRTVLNLNATASWSWFYEAAQTVGKLTYRL